MNTMRRFLKGDEGMVDSVIYWLRHISKEGVCNYYHRSYRIYPQ